MEPFTPPSNAVATHVVIATNPIAGRRATHADAQRLAEILTAQGMTVDVADNAFEAAQRAIEFHEQHLLRALVGVGGDGTLNRLANLTPPGLPLCVLPRGTENLLARYFHIGPTVEQVAETIAAGQTVTLDAGQANGQVFLLMASCGFDAYVCHTLAGCRRGHITGWSYAKPIWHSMRNYRYPELRVTPLAATAEPPHDRMNAWGEEPGPPATGERQAELEHLTGRWLFLFNLPCYGGGLRLAPRACGYDGRLDLCTFRRGGLWHALRYLLAVKTGWHQRLGDYAGRRVTGVRIESDQEVPFQLDGDHVGFLPLEIRVTPGRIRLVAPLKVIQRMAAAAAMPGRRSTI